MKIWAFDHPLSEPFAEASGLYDGSYTNGERSRPLAMEWEPGSDVIGDFTWPRLGIVVTERVGKALLERFRGFELGPVKMVQDAKVKRPTRITSRTRPRVWLPYEGPPLYELWITASVHADIARSSFRLTGLDPNTGAPRQHLAGYERLEQDYDFETGESYSTWVPREPGKGLYVAERALNGADIFRAIEASYSACTDRVRDFVLASGFTNIAFREMGETF